MNHNAITKSVRRWVDQVVVNLNLCPFAKRELVNQRVRFRVSDAVNEEQLLADLQNELRLLTEDGLIETTLLIHPQVLEDFHDYNQFLNVADLLLERTNLQGIYQVASFHPHYQFSGTAPDDVENYTNRSPFPLLHLLREDSVSQAIDSYPQADLIPDQNIERLRRLGVDKLRLLLQGCREPSGK